MGTKREKQVETISKEITIKILKDHGHKNYSELKDFIEDVGNKHIYTIKEVKNWLGY